MDYEQLLDEIMLMTLSAERFISDQLQQAQQVLIPASLEHYSKMFLSSSLLLLHPEKTTTILITLPQLPHDAEILQFSGTIGPHFGRRWFFPENPTQNWPSTDDQSIYPYMDQLFSYLSVLRTSENCQLIFLKTGSFPDSLKDHLSKQTNQNLLIVTDFFLDMEQSQAEIQAEKLLTGFSNLNFDTQLSSSYPILQLLGKRSIKGSEKTDQSPLISLTNTGSLGLNPQKTKTLVFYAR